VAIFFFCKTRPKNFFEIVFYFNFDREVCVENVAKYDLAKDRPTNLLLFNHLTYMFQIWSRVITEPSNV
jgi:hypothetical protein